MPKYAKSTGMNNNDNVYRILVSIVIDILLSIAVFRS